MFCSLVSLHLLYWILVWILQHNQENNQLLRCMEIRLKASKLSRLDLQEETNHNRIMKVVNRSSQFMVNQMLFARASLKLVVIHRWVKNNKLKKVKILVCNLIFCRMTAKYQIKVTSALTRSSATQIFISSR